MSNKFGKFPTHWHYVASLKMFVEFFGAFQMHPKHATGRISYELEGPVVFQERLARAR